MKCILTADQMKASDGRSIKELGIPSLVLMERAALQTVYSMEEHGIDLSKPLIVCGSGNNGGDGFAIARLLMEKGITPVVILAGRMASRSEETRTQMMILENMGATVGTELPDQEFSVVIDAVFGIGLCREIEGKYREIIERMNAYPCAKVAVDTPSGASSDTGEVLGVSFRADLTVTFAYGKIGQYLAPGREYAGIVDVREIGIINKPLEQSGDAVHALEPSDVKKLLPARSADGNKGTFGKVLCITGSKGMSGAAYLSALAAYRMGAGLVRIYTEESNRMILQQLLPEAILTTYTEETDFASELPELLGWASVVLAGCGLGQSAVSKQLIEELLLINEKPCVLDADGLNILAGFYREGKCFAQMAGKYILTPHMMEMARLTGRSVSELQKERFAAANAFARERGVCLVMKDSRTVIAAPDEPVFLNLSGNAALAKGGSGDVLAGVIAGLLAQHTTLPVAARLGVYLHGAAGDHLRDVMGERSPLASEVADALADVLMKYNN